MCVLGIGECVKTLTVTEKSNVKLNCTLSDLPDVSVSWTFNAMPAPFHQNSPSCEYGSGNNLMPISENCTQNFYLHLLNFRVCHQGIYKCVGNSSNGTITTYGEYNVSISQDTSS